MNRLFRSHRKGQFFSRLSFIVALTLTVGAAVFVGYTQQTSQPPAQALGGGVVGNVFVPLQVQLTAKPVQSAVGRYLPLPDFEVFLQNIDSGEISQPVKSNLFGRYVFPAQKAGTYQLRWNQQAGWLDGVLAKQIVVKNGTGSASFAEVKPQAGAGLLVGQVKHADGGSTWVYDEFFGVNKTPQVEALDANGSKVAGPVRVNSAGQFAIAGLPKAALQLQAKIEAAVASQAVPEDAVSFGGPVSPVTITFNERAPQILSVETKVDQKVVRTVAGGATVTVDVDAHSPDQRAMTFDWRLQEGMGELNAAGASARWVLPTAPRPYSGYVMVSDGFGGYAVASFGVLVGPIEKTSSSQSLQSEAQSGAPTTCLKVVLDDTALQGNGAVTSLVGSTIAAELAGNPVGVPALIAAGQHVVQLVGLPSDTDLKLTVSSNGTPIPGVIFETAPRSPLPDNVVHTEAVPDADCQTVKLTRYPFPASVSASFLNLDGAGAGDLVTAASYYALVDPLGLRTGSKKLGDWWQVNGFDSNGHAADEIRTSYLNNNDLGSGRDMHFLQRGGKVAAYVTNYVDNGDFNQNPTYADSAAAQFVGRQAATVCMEWSPVEGTSLPVVKFFVYNGANAGAVSTTSANLDGGGLKFVPQLCLNCHGGDFTAGSPNLHASFREFDLATFKFPGGRDVPNDVERAAFKQQNLIVRANVTDTISTSAIKDLVNGWYGIGADFVDPHPAFTGQNIRYNPPGWNDPPNTPPDSTKSPQYLYHTVVAKSCRTCHVAFTNNNLPGIDWTSFQQFSGFASEIAAPGGLVFSNTANVAPTTAMPHALVTFKNFWSSRNPSEAEILTNFNFPP
jgi:hypothetical protein